jgi:hypothetical protein
LAIAPALNLFDRLQQRDPAKYCAALAKKIADIEEELAELRINAPKQDVG